MEEDGRVCVCMAQGAVKNEWAQGAAPNNKIAPHLVHEHNNKCKTKGRLQIHLSK